MTKDEALKMCLEYIETNAHERKYVRHAIKEALALTSTSCEVQPEQEPVAWMTNDERAAFERFNETCEDGEGYDVAKKMMNRLEVIGVVHLLGGGVYSMTKFGHWVLDNTTSPKRKWVGLTDKEIDAALKSCNTTDTYKYFRAIEAKLKEKNHD